MVLATVWPTPTHRLPPLGPPGEANPGGGQPLPGHLAISGAVPGDGRSELVHDLGPGSRQQPLAEPSEEARRKWRTGQQPQRPVLVVNPNRPIQPKAAGRRGAVQHRHRPNQVGELTRAHQGVRAATRDPYHPHTLDAQRVCHRPHVGSSIEQGAAGLPG